MSNIVAGIASLAEGIAEVPSLIWGFFEDAFSDISDFWSDLFSDLGDFFSDVGVFWSDLFSALGNFFSDVADFWADLFTNLAGWFADLVVDILAGIRRIFIPNTTNINSSINSLSTKFENSLGVDSVDLSGVMGTSTTISDQSGTVTISGYSFTSKFLDVSYIKTAVNSFRPYIRGFVILLLIIYNVNQFLIFIGAGSLTQGANMLLNHANNDSAPGGFKFDPSVGTYTKKVDKK